MSRVIELEAQLSEVVGELSVWKSFVNHEGWQRYKQVLQGQADERIKMYRVPLQGMDAVLGQEFTKGETSGIEIAFTLPENEVERLEAERDQLLKELENESAQSNGVDSDGGSTSDGSTDSREPISPDNDAFGTGND